MPESRHAEPQMIGALMLLEAGRKAEGVAREVGVSKRFRQGVVCLSDCRCGSRPLDVPPRKERRNSGEMR
jgi:hypothetical protein